ncbi:hypothetical protein [Pseudarthrobacter sp.]|uniref:hypothetical protein n=1 Tax=Pseudarthrobacter sp. TaxID=1934409 RepID=UPI003FA7794C
MWRKTISPGIRALSYSGQLNMVIVANTGAIPDLEVFSSGFSQAFSHLRKGSQGP